MRSPANNWVQATPDRAFLFFVSQWPGAPDPSRSVCINTAKIKNEATTVHV